MNAFAEAMAPKSDQINAQDLLAGDLTITIEDVKVTPGTEQPVSIRFRGATKVWRPCKTTGRILMAAWGADTSQYPGRSVQLYLDPEVKWGGMKVGGIRIRAMSHINGELRLALAESKQNRKIVTVQPLATAATDKPAPARDSPQVASPDALHIAKREAAKGTDHFRAWFNSDEGKECRATGEVTPAVLAECRTIASGADALASRLADDPFGAPAPDATTTDAEIQSRLADEQAEFERQRAAEEAAEMARLDAEGGGE